MDIVYYVCIYIYVNLPYMCIYIYTQMYSSIYILCMYVCIYIYTSGQIIIIH